LLSTRVRGCRLETFETATEYVGVLKFDKHDDRMRLDQEVFRTGAHAAQFLG
jgi:hypothetical protein